MISSCGSKSLVFRALWFLVCACAGGLLPRDRDPWVFVNGICARVVLCSGYQEQRPGFGPGVGGGLFCCVFEVGLFYAPAAFLSASALSVFSQVNPGFVVTVSVRVFL